MTLTNAGLKPFVSRFLKIQLNSDSLSGLSEWLANLRLGQKSLKVVLVEVVDIKNLITLAMRLIVLSRIKEIWQIVKNLPKLQFDCVNSQY